MPELIRDVENKMWGDGIVLTDPEQISTIIEEPLVKAVALFLAKNILTIATSANKYDASDNRNGYGYIFLDNHTLSVNNRLTLAEIGSGCRIEGGALWPSCLPVPITPDATVTEIEELALGIASTFHEQESWRAVPLTELEARQKLRQIDQEYDGTSSPYYHPQARLSAMRIRDGKEHHSFYVVPDAITE